MRFGNPKQFPDDETFEFAVGNLWSNAFAEQNFQRHSVISIADFFQVLPRRSPSKGPSVLRQAAQLANRGPDRSALCPGPVPASTRCTDAVIPI